MVEHEVDAFRALMLTRGVSDYGLALDFSVMAAAAGLLIALAARMHRRMDY